MYLHYLYDTPGIERRTDRGKNLMLNYIKEGEKKIMNNNDYENLDDMLDEVDA